MTDATINESNSLPAIFKWTGGKRREIKHFQSFFPDFVLNNHQYKYVEPFVGGGAVFFHLNNINGENVINDFDSQVVNFYQQFQQNNSRFHSELHRIGKISNHDSLEKEYYRLRNQDKKGGLTKQSSIDQAIRFFVVNQLAFSGMRRFNASGEFNVPFGHYKGLNADVIGSEKHINLLSKTKIVNGDFENIMKDNDDFSTFMFLDPPYTRVFKEYSADNLFGEKDHIRLSQTIKSLKYASVMMIIDKSDFTDNLYQGMVKQTYSLKYGVNIKNRFNTAVKHLVVCNY